MKKKLFYLASICIGLAFAACSSDDGDGSSAPVQTLTDVLLTHQDEAITLSGLDDINAPFEEMVFTETGRVIIGPFTNGGNASNQRRTEGESSSKYIIGTYKTAGAVYTVYNDDGTVYCTVELISQNGKKANVKITLLGAAEFEGEASVGEKIAADDVTKELCREWTIATTRLRHTDGVSAVMQFEKGKEYKDGVKYDPSSLNDILAYAKTVAAINESFDEDMYITSIEFTTDGSFIIYFKNGKNYVGKWYWKDKAKGYIKYDWNDEDMGNKFENGEGIFSVQTFQKQKYRTLTFGAKVEEDKTYKVELSFYLNEKTK